MPYIHTTSLTTRGRSGLLLFYEVSVFQIPYISTVYCTQYCALWASRAARVGRGLGGGVERLAFCTVKSEEHCDVIASVPHLTPPSAVWFGREAISHFTRVCGACALLSSQVTLPAPRLPAPSLLVTPGVYSTNNPISRPCGVSDVNSLEISEANTARPPTKRHGWQRPTR